MPKKQERWYNHGWTIAITTTVLTIALPTFWDIIKSLPFLTTIKVFFNYIGTFLNYTVKVKWIILYILFWAVARAIKDEVNKKTYKKINSKLPPYLYYQADRFGSWDWRWDWNYNTLIKEWEIKNLAPVCKTPSCNYNPLVYEKDITYGTNHKCSVCKVGYFVAEHENGISDRIIKKISHGDFRITTTNIFETETFN